MSYPTKYTRQYDYVAYQNANPNRPLPADKVHADLNLAAMSTSEIVEFLKGVMRSDGAIANGAVDFDQLSVAVKATIGEQVATDELLAAAAQATADAATSTAAAVSATASAGSATTSASTASAAAVSAAASATVTVGNPYAFETSISMAAPAAGGLRFNSATLASVTALAINAQTSASGNPNIRLFIATWDDSTNTALRGTILVRKIGIPATFAVFSVNAVLTDNTSWLQIPVAYVTGNGTFSASDALSVQFTRTGDAGTGVSSIAGNIGPFTVSTGLKNATNDLQVDPAYHRGQISGLGLSTAGASATFGIGAGVAVDSTSAAFMLLASAYTKTTSAWAVGSGNGAMDTGSVANSTWYHVHLIKRLDTGVVDVLFSLSATAPTLPANYTVFRRIGSMLTNGSAQWAYFKQLGDEFLWDIGVTNVSSSPGTTAIQTLTVTSPPGVQTNVLLNAVGISGAGNDGRGWIFSPDINSVAAVAGASSYALSFGVNAVSGSQSVSTPSVRTNTSSQVKYSMANAGGTPVIATVGWIDTRGRFA